MINKVEYNTSNYVSEISDGDIKAMIEVIQDHFSYLTDRNVEDYFGLPYTSSSAFAGIWNTNIEQVYDGDKYIQGFTLTGTGDVVLLADERDDTEHAYIIGNIRQRTVKTIDVQGRSWRDRTYGNTYFSARVTINYGMPDETILYIPFQYGYGDHYLDVAKQTLQTHGYLPTGDGDYYGRLTSTCSALNIILRYDIHETKKRDAKAFGEV